MYIPESLVVIFSVLASLIVVFSVVALGWVCVWKLLLSRFKLVREILGLAQASDSPSHSENLVSDGNRPRGARRSRRRD